MSAQGAVIRGRRAAESLMTLTLRWYRPDGYLPDGPNGVEQLQFLDLGTTPGKVQGPTSSQADAATTFVKVGEVDRPLMRSGAHIPIGAFLPKAGEHGRGWECVVESAPAPADPSLVGRRYRVHNVPAKSSATARRLDVVEVDPL